MALGIRPFGTVSSMALGIRIFGTVSCMALGIRQIVHICTMVTAQLRHTRSSYKYVLSL